MKKLTSHELARALRALHPWKGSTDAISRTITFSAYQPEIKFVNAVARIAEMNDHHPDLWVGYRKLRIRLTTHSAGGVTRKDLAFAREVEQTLFRTYKKLK